MYLQYTESTWCGYEGVDHQLYKMLCARFHGDVSALLPGRQDTSVLFFLRTQDTQEEKLREPQLEAFLRQAFSE